VNSYLAGLSQKAAIFSPPWRSSKSEEWSAPRGWLAEIHIQTLSSAVKSSPISPVFMVSEFGEFFLKIYGL